MKDQHKYIAFDQATQQRMGAMMSAMQDQMRQRMQSLPEAQRKQMEAALGRAGAPEVQGGHPFREDRQKQDSGSMDLPSLSQVASRRHDDRILLRAFERGWVDP